MENTAKKEADRFKNVMRALVGDDAKTEITKEEERLGLAAQKILRNLAKGKHKEVPRELIDYSVATAKREATNTMQYLMFERQIASYNFRKNIHLSDIDLEALISNNQIALMNQSREFHILKSWLMFSGYLEDFVAYRDIVEAGIQAELAKDRAAAKVPDPARVAENAIDARRQLAKEKFK